MRSNLATFDFDSLFELSKPSKGTLIGSGATPAFHRSLSQGSPARHALGEGAPHREAEHHSCSHQPVDRQGDAFVPWV